MKQTKIRRACGVVIGLLLMAGPLQAQKMDTALTDEQWDLLLSSEAGLTCGDTQLMGIEFAGGFFFVAGGNSGGDPNKIYILNPDGSYFGEFDQDSATDAGFSGLAFDGTYFYGCEDNVIKAFDLTGNPIPEMNITIPFIYCEAITYDPEVDHFYILSTGELFEIDREGTATYIPMAYVGATGLAWDDGAPDGPWMWMFCQFGNPQTVIRQFNPLTQSLTGLSYTVPLLPGSTAQVSADLFFTGEWDEDVFVVGGITQGTPNDQLFVLEMYPQSTTTPNVDVELTYVSGSPVPPGGGNIVFDVWVENLESQALDFDAWLESSYEGGAPTTLVQRSFTNYLPGWTINRPGTWYPVPALWAAGNYRLSGKVGVYPDEAWDESSFPFDKSGDSDDHAFIPWPVAGAPNPFDRIDKGVSTMPDKTELVGVYPNPFNPSTVIGYQLSAVSHVNLTVYDITGREVATLVDRLEDAGSHEVTFDASHLASGVYLYRMTVNENVIDGKLVLMK
jgi:hypothetical protein